MKLKILFVFCVFGFSFSYGQKLIRNSVNTMGNEFQSNGLKLTQTVGQSANHLTFYAKNKRVKLQQGFQQPATNHNNLENNSLDFTVFPNPNNGSFSIAFNERISGELHFSLSDIQGKTYKEGNLPPNAFQEFHFQLPAGMYFLHLKTATEKTGTAKISVIP